MPSWQAQRAILKPPRPAKLELPAGALCFGCGCPRSSHSRFTLSGACKAAGCTCKCFDAMCTCGHLLVNHMFGTAPNHYACAECRCQRFTVPSGWEQQTLS